jgi:soluble lytic murein transglycosylase-like protein
MLGLLAMTSGSAGQTERPAPSPKPADVAPASKIASPENAAPSGTAAAMEARAQKQRDAAIAAMQASIDKQRASVAAAVASAEGKQAAPPNDAFFNLPPFPPAEMPAAFDVIPEVDCPAVPEAELAPLLDAAARREGLEPRLMTAIIQQESAFRPCAESKKGAQGLMQLMPATSERFGVKDPFDIKQNLDAGAKFLKELLARYGGSLALALGAYNAGPTAVDATGAVPPIPETSNYVTEILSRLKTLTTNVPAQ